MSNDDADLSAAVRLMERTLHAYRDRLELLGQTPEADSLRMQFAGEKFMVEALLGPQPKEKVLVELRARKLAIPHCGDRAPDGGLIGWDSDADS
jgi:hypothetical protein